jgi:hypothetical protein
LPRRCRNTTLKAATNLDHRTDFTTLDEIDLDNAVFTTLTTTGTRGPRSPQHPVQAPRVGANRR